MTSRSSIRKAAILVAQLDERSADALLDQTSPDLAEKIRNAVLALEEVSSAEQEQVLSEFLGLERGGNSSSTLAEAGVEIDLSTGDERDLASARPAACEGVESAAQREPLGFLRHVELSALAETLAQEHPQLVAVVISHLAAESAGQVLEQLPSSLATEALSRMASLAEPAPEALVELERELQRRLAARDLGPDTRAAAVDSIQAILASLPQARRWQWLERLAQQDERLAQRLGRPIRQNASAPPPTPRKVDVRRRIETSSLEFDDLDRLSNDDLATLVRAADPAWLALALCEADQRLTARVLKSLPPDVAASVRGQLAQPGPVRLRAIDQAQRRFLELARYLAGRREIVLPGTRRFTVAV